MRSCRVWHFPSGTMIKTDNPLLVKSVTIYDKWRFFKISSKQNGFHNLLEFTRVHPKKWLLWPLKAIKKGLLCSKQSSKFENLGDIAEVSYFEPCILQSVSGSF